jgi:polysaccharide export outer membrane protein
MIRKDAGQWICVVGLLGVLAAPTVARAQQPPQPPSHEYVIGAEDVLQISVFGHPELERTVTVNAAGLVTFPPLGELKAAGLTPKQASDRLGERLSTYLRQTTTATVSVREFLSHSVYISGAVARPGRFGFETMPPLLDVLNQAGGALPGADMTHVVIIRKEAGGRRQITVDLSSALEQGTESSLPVLQPGDAIVVMMSASATGTSAGDAVGILGAVGKPGLYPIGTGEELWRALALAGGPTPASNLRNIRVLTKENNTPTTVTVDLRETLERGNKTPYILKPGDIVFVDARRVSMYGVFRELIAVSSDIANLVLVIDALKHP